MKKYFSLLIVLLVAVFIGMGNVYAEYDYDFDTNCSLSDNLHEHICTPKFKVNKATSEKIVYITIQTKNSSTKSISFKDTWTKAAEYEVTPTSGYDKAVRYKLVYKSGSWAVGTYEVADMVVTTSDQCAYSITAQFGEFRCEKDAGKYYNKTGEVVSKEDFVTSCKCRQEGEELYGSEGTVVDRATYIKQCASETACRPLPDWTYINSEGNVVDKATYAADTVCNKKCYADEETGKYYDKDGNLITSPTAWAQQCSPITCAVFEFVNQETGVVAETAYIGADGGPATASEYKQQCRSCVITKDTGKYYDKAGEETDKAGYIKSCTSATCKKFTDGTLVGKNGDVVNEVEFQKQCGINICTKVGDTFFNAEGKEVSEADFKASCEAKPSCEIKDGKYYDKNGKEVSKKEFDNKCPDAPPTGDNTTLKMYLYVGIGLIFTVGIMYFSKKHAKINKI